MRNQLDNENRIFWRAFSNSSSPMITAHENQTFQTEAGWVVVSDLRVGDTVLGSDGEPYVVEYFREIRADNQAAHRTRFPGVRFVRGKPADVVFQLMMRPLSENVAVSAKKPSHRASHDRPADKADSIAAE